MASEVPDVHQSVNFAHHLVVETEAVEVDDEDGKREIETFIRIITNRDGYRFAKRTPFMPSPFTTPSRSASYSFPLHLLPPQPHPQWNRPPILTTRVLPSSNSIMDDGPPSGRRRKRIENECIPRLHYKPKRTAEVAVAKVQNVERGVVDLTLIHLTNKVVALLDFLSLWDVLVGVQRPL